MLNAGERVAMLVGAGASGALAEITAVADRSAPASARALNGRAVVPDDLPWVTGSIGLLGTRPSYDLMEGCDTLLMVGSSFPYSEWLPEPGQARGVQIDLDAPHDRHALPDRGQPRRRRRRDAARAAAAAGPQGGPLLARGGRGRRRRAGGAVLEEQAPVPADPINPQLVFHELSPRLPDRAILTADTGTATDWWARHLKVRAGMDAIVSGTLASMGPGVPYALAAKLAFPDRPGSRSSATARCRCWDERADRSRQVRAARPPAARRRRAQQPRPQPGHLGAAGDVGRPQARRLPDPARRRLRRVRPLLGLHGERVEDPAEVGDAWDRALAAGRPAVLDIVTDPEVPPLPPHIRFEQAKELTRAIAHGDPAAPQFMKQSLRARLAELLTR